jgi:hypothetical protein
MSNFVVGPGVAQAMTEAGDEPRSDEVYLILEPGEKISQTFGRDNLWLWIEKDNAVRRCPF